MFKNLLHELSFFIKGKTIDAIIPPILFVILSSQFKLIGAVLASFIVAFILFLYRVVKKQNFNYGLVGILSLAMASLFSLLTNSSSYYFLPDMLTNVFLIIVGVVSLLVGKPFAALASHLTRAWPIDWYWRKDIKPAYVEVSIVWLSFFSFKLFVQLNLILNSQSVNFGLNNILLGLPFTIFVMSVSYIYGIKRLKHLKGPSVDEYLQKKESPFIGQTNGF